MKKLSLTLLTCLLFLSPNVVLSETLDDLVYRDVFIRRSSVRFRSVERLLDRHREQSRVVNKKVFGLLTTIMVS